MGGWKFVLLTLSRYRNYSSPGNSSVMITGLGMIAATHPAIQLAEPVLCSPVDATISLEPFLKKKSFQEIFRLNVDPSSRSIKRLSCQSCAVAVQALRLHYQTPLSVDLHEPGGPKPAAQGLLSDQAPEDQQISIGCSKVRSGLHS